MAEQLLLHHFKGQTLTILRPSIIESTYQEPVAGWIEGVKLMAVGSKYQFVIPPALGYGDRGNPRIPANSILVFDIELLEIVTEADKGEK